MHIQNFQRFWGAQTTHFTQSNLDSYWHQQDGTKPSKSIQKMRKAALKFYLVECLDLPLKFDQYKATGKQDIRPHKAHSKSEMEGILGASRDDEEMHALVSLLYDMAARIQDVVGLTFGQITKAKKNINDIREVDLPAKKTTARTVTISETAY